MATVVSSISVVVISLSVLVAWPQTSCAFLGGSIGGIFGSRIARHMSPSYLRIPIIVLGVAPTAF